MTDDSSLIKGLLLGDENAYETLYTMHYGVLCLFARRYVEDSYVAETMVSDVIYNIWRKKESLTINTSLRNYLMQSVKNRCINHIEQQKKQSALKTHYADDITAREMSFESESEYPLATILSKELDLKIQQVLNSLPEKTRDIFLLSRSADLKYADIALQTNMSVDSVKYHIKSALSTLREELKDYLLSIILFLSLFL